jgi:predicted small lipoprotein YifL
MRRVTSLFMTAVILGVLAGCGDGGLSQPTGATAPPPPPQDLEKLFKKPGTKSGAPKRAFQDEPRGATRRMG